MIRKGDIQWWVLEAKKHPEAAPDFIEELAERLIALDAENERLRKEVMRLQRRTASSTTEAETVSALRRRVKMLQGLLEGEVAEEPAVLLISETLNAARLPIPQVRRLSREGQPLLDRQAPFRVRSLLLTRPYQDLLLLTSRARGLKVASSAVPLLIEEGDWPTLDGPQLAGREWLTAAATVGQPPRFWTIITRRGYVRQRIHVGVEQRIESERPLIESPFRRDAPVAIVSGDRGDLLVLSRWGQYVRFPQHTIPPEGTMALELEPDDEVVAALPLAEDTEILVTTASGLVLRRATAQLSAHARPGRAGKMLIQAYDALDVFPYAPQDQLLYLTYSGQLVLAPRGEVPLQHRAGKGVLLRDLDRDPAVAATVIPGTL